SFGVVASLIQLFPAELIPGVFIDTRGVPIMFAGIIGGPVAGVIATIFGALTRYLLGGIGIYAGLVFATVFGLGGILSGYLLHRKDVFLPSIKFSIFMALIVSASASVATLFLPPEVRYKLLTTLWPMLIIANIIGCIVFTKILQQIEIQKQYSETLEVKNVEQLQEILKQQKYLEILNKYSPGALAMFDNDMRYLLVSNRWLSDYGREGKDVIGMSHYEDFPEIPDKWRNIHRRALQGETLKSDQDLFRREDGVDQWLRWEVRPWYDSDNKIGGIIIFSEDITRLKELEKEKISHFKTATESAELANRNKSQFLANMSHELRTPMHAINSFSSIGSKKTTDGKAKDYFNKIHTSGLRLTKLLDDLLDLSKLEAGKLEVNLSLNDLCATVRNVVDDIDSLLKEKSIEVKFTGCSSYACKYDEKLIERVIMNLLSNAIKFSPPDSFIEINSEVLQSNNAIQISVIDNGVGIPKEELKDIFDSFVQSSKTKTQSGGTGLGLAISREIIDLHRGEIWAESPVKGRESGTAFFFKLPFQDS
ncbi:MAG: ATP-binding protein, partial [Draconibacterium sp.]|nr:ATP-binding protein [Draconibacterium sp.]